VKSRHLAPHVGRIFWSALAIALNRLPEDLQRRLQQSARMEVCIFRQNQVRLFQEALSEKREAAESALNFGEGLGELPRMKDSYDWIRRKNDDLARFGRLAAASRTFQAIWERQYEVAPTDSAACKVKLLHIDEMLRSSVIRRAGQIKYDQCNQRGETRITVAQDITTPVMELAAQLTQEGRRVAAVNAASAHHIGGGVLTGGRHALEEAWCMTSTLLKSLQQVHSSTAGRHGADSGYIPQDGIVLSPLVEVFRCGTDAGYAFRTKPVVLAAVVSVAMYNCNSRVKDSPVDVPDTLAAYEEGTRQKFRAMVAAAAEVGADVLVCPDIGCGVFENDPVKVGTLLGEVLREPSLAGLVSEVLVTGNGVFASACEKAAAGEPMASAWAPLPRPSAAAAVAVSSELALRPSDRSQAKALAKATAASRFEPPPRRAPAGGSPAGVPQESSNCIIS